MGSRKIETGNKYVAKKSAHPLIPAVDFASPEQRVNSNRLAIPGAARSLNLGRHSALCRICAHARRQEIEDDFIDWVSPAKIAVDYKLSDRSSVYRHAHALNLFPKRRRNNRAVLERILERVDDVEVSASAIVAAVQAYAKINARGEWVEREETLNLDDIFEKMNLDELKAFAVDGKLPAWAEEAIREAGGKVLKGGDDE